ncbi:diaminopimelate decarboxylase [Thermodesulfatator atlanticus]
MREPYEKPIIRKVQVGLSNKFGSVYGRHVRPEIDGIPIGDLVSSFGSPLFVFSEKRLRSKYRQIYQLFSTRYPNVHFSWSYKTNYLDAICAILHQEGETAEVVSEFEYEKARRLGVPGSEIIFNGPYKPLPALKRAVQEGAIINIDHFDEIYDLEDIAEELGQQIKVGIRLNMDTGISPQWTRFGFNLESGQAMDAAKRIVSGGKLILNGLHCHLGTFLLEPRAYARAVEKLVDFAYQIEDNFDLKIEYLDLGGGFPSRNRLKGIYLSPEVAVPPLEDFAEAICDTLLAKLRPNDFPKLILETGRAIVDEAGFLITTVVASKRLPDGTRSYVVDAGVNILFTAFWYNFRVELEEDVPGPAEPCVIYGPLCMNIDVVAEQVQLPPLPRGIRLIFSPVGAYNVTQWMQFIRYRPAVVLINENGEAELIREAENLEDIIARERLPERLRLKSS